MGNSGNRQQQQSANNNWQMRKYILFVILPILFWACRAENSEYSIKLDKVQQCIEVHPDSALQVLQSFTLNELHTSAGRARYALLKSMALDKNYIDVTNDSLTSIAVAYYKKHGTADEKLKAYYYNGKVKRYSGDYEGAMENYILAEKNVKRASDNVSIGRLYNAKMNLYKVIFDMEKAVRPAELSAYYYLLAKDTSRYLTALNSLSSILVAANKYEILARTFIKIDSLYDYMSLSQKEAYYSNKINYKIAVDDSSVADYINDYRKHFVGKEHIIDWLILIRAYSYLGDYPNALEAIDKYKMYNENLNSLYYFFAADVYNAIGKYDLAYKYLKHHNTNYSINYNKLFKSDAKFIEERNAREEDSDKQKLFIVILVLGLALIMLTSVLVFIFVRSLINKKNNNLRELEEQKAMLSDLYEKAIAEQHKFSSMIENKSLDESMVKVIEERLEILNRFIVANISGVNMDKSQKVLKQFLKDNDNFLQSTIMSFELTHPRFIAYLKEQRLTEWETACCCLYCIGLNGSEIASYLNVKYFYKSSSAIRKKLGVEAVNIDTYLSNKIKELS